MFGKLIDKWREDAQTRQILKIPAVQGGREAIHQYWTNNTEVIKDFSAGFVQKIGGEMMTKVIQIATSENPLMANREALCTYAHTFAQFQVLVLEPAPLDDPAGLRGIYGISGKLKERLVEIAEKNKEIKTWMHGIGPVNSWDDIWNPVLGQYRINYAWAHVFQLLRAQFKDFNASGKDWFRPLLTCLCGWHEHLIRDSIGLPTLMGDPIDANLKALMLSSFFNRVMEGHQYPDLQYIESIKAVQNGEWFDELKPIYS